MRRGGWRLFKGLLSLPLLGLVAAGLHDGLTRGNSGGYVMATVATLGLLALWAELLGAHRIERWLPWLGLAAGTALIVGAPFMTFEFRQCAGRGRLPCELQQMLLITGGPRLAALPYALLGAVALFCSAKALRRRR